MLQLLHVLFPPSEKYPFSHTTQLVPDFPLPVRQEEQLSALAEHAEQLALHGKQEVKVFPSGAYLLASHATHLPPERTRSVGQLAQLVAFVQVLQLPPETQLLQEQVATSTYPPGHDAEFLSHIKHDERWHNLQSLENFALQSAVIFSPPRVIPPL